MYEGGACWFSVAHIAPHRVQGMRHEWPEGRGAEVDVQLRFGQWITCAHEPPMTIVFEERRRVQDRRQQFLSLFEPIVRGVDPMDPCAARIGSAA